MFYTVAVVLLRKKFILGHKLLFREVVGNYVKHRRQLSGNWAATIRQLPATVQKNTIRPPAPGVSARNHNAPAPLPPRGSKGVNGGSARSAAALAESLPGDFSLRLADVEAGGVSFWPGQRKPPGTIGGRQAADAAP